MSKTIIFPGASMSPAALLSAGAGAGTEGGTSLKSFSRSTSVRGRHLATERSKHLARWKATDVVTSPILVLWVSDRLFISKKTTHPTTVDERWWKMMKVRNQRVFLMLDVNWQESRHYFQIIACLTLILILTAAVVLSQGTVCPGNILDLTNFLRGNPWTSQDIFILIQFESIRKGHLWRTFQEGPNIPIAPLPSAGVATCDTTEINGRFKTAAVTPNLRKPTAETDSRVLSFQ